MTGAPRLAMFTPLPPSETGTAEYAADLIQALSKLVRLHVFHRVNPKTNLNSYDAVIYQIANNPFHAPFYDLALRHPGIVVLHEPNLHDLIKNRTLHARNEAAYLNEVRYEIYGGAHVPSAGPFEIPQPRKFVMLRRILHASTKAIVHSQHAAREVHLKNFRKPLFVIPHGASVRSLDAAPYRRKLGIAPHHPLIGIFGYQRPDKRGLESFRVFRELLTGHPEAHLLIAGKLHSEMRTAEWIREMNLTGRVHLIGFQTLEDYDGYLAACDVVLNLRHPTFGETSGTMMRAFGLGKTVIVSDAAAYREPPSDVALRIPPDAYEEPVLLETLSWLLDDRSRTIEIGRAAQEWIRRCCTWERVAQQYAHAATNIATDTEADPAPSTELPEPTLRIGNQAGKRLPFPNETFASLTCESLAAEGDPMQLLFEAHRILMESGVLVLKTTPPGFQPDEIRMLLEDAGFCVSSIQPTVNEIVATARRDSVPKRRYPAWLYQD